MLEGVAWARALSEAPAAAVSTATAATAQEDSQDYGTEGQHAARLVRRPAGSSAPKSDVRKMIKKNTAK